jgi:hypothetical protein
MILRNQGVCAKCQDFIVSIHTHDYRSCKCGASAVDGGPSYLRRMGEVEDRSIVLDHKVSRDVALQYIAILYALQGKSWKKTRTVLFAMKQKHKKMPWLPVPKDSDQLRRWLRKCVAEGLIEESGGNVAWQTCYWRTKFELAPYTEASSVSES